MLPPDLLLAFAVGLVTGGFMAGIWSSLVRPPETSSRVVGFPSSPRPPAPNVPRPPPPMLANSAVAPPPSNAPRDAKGLDYTEINRLAVQLRLESEARQRAKP